MRGVGTDESWVVEDMSGDYGMQAIAVHYRRPLRVDEVNQMAETPEVKTRPGRP